MRHIPEDELHAYLDQALSRAQAVEIESHLAACARCQAERDGIAGLRDRTTALLAALAPAHTVQRPAYAELRRRHLVAAAHRAQLLRGGIWAASLVGAISLGYLAHSWKDAATRGATPMVATETPATTPATTPSPVTTVALVSTPTRRSTTVSDRPGRVRRPVGGMDLDTLESLPNTPAGGVWRTESYESAIAAGLTVPRVAGLPVLQIQVQVQNAGLPDSQSVVAVDQQLDGGERFRTYSGPADEVTALERSAVASATPGTGNANAAVSSRTGNRKFLMTGRISADTLHALIARLNKP